MASRVPRDRGLRLARFHTDSTTPRTRRKTDVTRHSNSLPRMKSGLRRRAPGHLILATALALAPWLTQPGAAEAATIKRGPYLQIGTATGMTIKWNTDVATNAQVKYGSSPTSLTSTASSSTS